MGSDLSLVGYSGSKGPAALRAKLEETRGREYWRSLEELADTPEFQESVWREFPPGARGPLQSI